MSDIKNFEYGFWLLCFDSLLTYGMTITSVMEGTDMLMKRFGFSDSKSAMTIEYQFLVSAFLLPMLGAFIDKHGRFFLVMMSGAVINLLTHIFLIMLPDCEDCNIAMVPYMIYGISFSVYIVAMWGAVPFVITEKKSLGTAYGILACL